MVGAYRKWLEVIQEDLTNPRGQRNVIDGEAELLEGFEFNISGKLGTSLVRSIHWNHWQGGRYTYRKYFLHSCQSTCLQRQGGYPFQNCFCRCRGWFWKWNLCNGCQATAVLPWDSAATAVITLVNTVTANSKIPLFLALGNWVLPEVNGSNVSFENSCI